MIPESRRLRRGRARPCQKSVAAHTQARKQGRGKGPGKAAWLRSAGQGGSSRKKPENPFKDGRKKNKYGETSNVEQPGPRKRSFPKSPRCRVCQELPSPASPALLLFPVPRHRETSSALPGHLKPRGCRGQALLPFPRTGVYSGLGHLLWRAGSRSGLSFSWFVKLLTGTGETPQHLPRARVQGCDPMGDPTGHPPQLGRRGLGFCWAGGPQKPSLEGQHGHQAGGEGGREEQGRAFPRCLFVFVWF